MAKIRITPHIATFLDVGTESSKGCVTRLEHSCFCGREGTPSCFPCPYILISPADDMEAWQTAHFGLYSIALVMHLRQKTCPHFVTTGCSNSSRHMGQRHCPSSLTLGTTAEGFRRRTDLWDVLSADRFVLLPISSFPLSDSLVDHSGFQN
jgi:hypothetical protein